MQASRRPRWPMVVGWHALVKAALRAPPVAASALTRTCHPTFVATHEFDGGVRLIQRQMPCQVFSWRQIYAVSDSRSQPDSRGPSEPSGTFPVQLRKVLCGCWYY